MRKRTALLAGVALGALTSVAFAQTSWIAPGFQGQVTLSIKPTGLSTYDLLENWLGNAAIPQYLTGADPTGVADSAPAFRAAIASNKLLIVPAGTYRFSSTVTAPCCFLDPPAVLAQSLSNFAVIGYGATIVIDNSIALSSAFQFDRDTNFKVAGLTIQGSRSGLSAGAENAGITLTSDVNFHIEDIHFSTGFGGNGAPFAGDWLVNGIIDNIQMDTAGICFDVAFLLHVTIDKVYAKGADTNGASGAGQIGNKCVSVVNDVPNAATNHTGVSFTQTDDVTIRRVDASNFSTGAAISSGTHYTFTHNAWHDNPGLGGAKGIGIYIFYTNGGNFTSELVQPSDILIDGDMIYNNGSASSGYGVLLNSSGISNGDVMKNFSITNVMFDNNTAIGVDSFVTSSMSNISIGNNMYSGANQTTSVGNNLQTFSILRACSSATQSQTAPISDGSVATWGTTIAVGGGANHVLLFCDGTNWTVAGK